MNFAKANREGPFGISKIVAHRVRELVNALFDVRWSDNFNRVASCIGVVSGIEKGGDAAEMISMKMGDQEDI